MATLTMITIFPVQFYKFNWYIAESEKCFILFDSSLSRYIVYNVLQHCEKIANIYDSLFNQKKIIKYPIKIVLYNSLNHFYTQRIINEIVTPNIGGFTTNSDKVIAIYFDGSLDNTKYVFTHELNHFYLISIFSRVPYKNKEPPIWFWEGIAEYYAHKLTKINNEWIAYRNLFTWFIIEKYGVNINLLYYFPYHIGLEFFKFVSYNYGDTLIDKIIEKSINVYPVVDKFNKISYEEFITLITNDRSLFTKLEFYLKQEYNEANANTVKYDKNYEIAK